MKRNLLLTGAAICALGALAQTTNYAPQNWRFDQMQAGTAESIFLREIATGGWNCPAPFAAYDGKGGIAIATGGAGVSSNSYASMTDEEKAYLEDFYTNAQIVTTTFTTTDTKEQTTENVLCMVGKDATETYGTGTARVNSFPNPALFLISGNEDSSTPMTVGRYYRLTIDYRVITEAATGSISVTIADNSYNGIDIGTGLGSGSYRTGELAIYGDLSGEWNRGIFDFYVADNTEEGYRELPLAVKCYIANGLMDNSIFLFRTIKLEEISEVDPANVPCNNNEVPNYTDEPGTNSVEQIGISEGAIVTAANGKITVIDANAPIEVYNMSGAKVAYVAAPSMAESISLDMNGVFVVKVGETVKKVIL